MKKLILAFAFLLVVVPSQARTITVDDDGLADFDNIQAAIEDANDGDIIEVQPGTYTGPGNRDIDFIGKAITVRSTDPNDPSIVAATIIDCENSGRGFYFHSGETTASVVAGLTITSGAAHDGAAIHITQSSPTILNCMVVDNWGHIGGGIFFWEAGGGTVANCVIRDNVADAEGGAIDCWFSSGIRLTNSIIAGNHAGTPPVGNGGAVWCNTSEMTVSGCTFTHNSVVGQYEGPGSDWGNGGAIWCHESTLTISNCIFWGDSATNKGPELYGCAVVSYSDVQGGHAGVGNIDVDPSFADPCNGDYHLKSQAGRWDPNSESWVKDSVTSPTIDAGNPACPLGDEPNDANNVRINLGAYGGTAEASKTPANWRSIADLTNDWLVDYNDLSVFIDYWLEAGQCIPSDLDRSQPVNFSDFSIFAHEQAEAGQARCFPRLHPHYANWLTVGEPNCWCHPRQCHGDADGQPEGDPKSGYYYVGNVDLAILQAVWTTAPPGCWPANHGDCPNYEPCADFDHDLDVDDNDVSILETWYKVIEPPDGSGVPADCLQY